MNPHFAKAIETYETQGLDFQEMLGWHLQHGIVICDAGAFILAYHSNSRDPQAAVLREHADTVFVTFYTGDLRRGLVPYADEYEFLSFSRDFQNSHRCRLLRMDKFRTKPKR